MKKLIAIVLVGASLLGVGITACGGTDADVASKNLSTAAEQFEVPRRIVFYNGITDKIMSTIEGFCSIETPEGTRKLEVTCKTDKGYFKDYLGLSDNVSFYVMQLEDLGVSTSHYRVVIKPSTLIPDIDIP